MNQLVPSFKEMVLKDIMIFQKRNQMPRILKDLYHAFYVITTVLLVSLM